MKLFGACRCGYVRYEVEDNLTNRCFCHCESCRRSSGAPFVAWGTSKVDDFQVLTGEMALHASSPKVQRGFCTHCGTSLTYANVGGPSTLDVALATLDQPQLIPPEFHIWLADKLEWVTLGDDLPKFDGWRVK